MPGVGGKGIDTVLETINRWAPSNENDTQAYAGAVAKRLGVHPADPINIKEPATLRVFVESIIIHENGGNPYKAEVIDDGIRRALA
ncbi:hypothetical protein D3C85_1695720 [compost metagenome]